MVIETPLECLIFGKISKNIHEDHTLMLDEEEKAHELMQHYFSVEDFAIRVLENLPESKETKRTKKMVAQTLKYDGNRYEIRLLWKQDNSLFQTAASNQ